MKCLFEYYGYNKKEGDVKMNELDNDVGVGTKGLKNTNFLIRGGESDNALSFIKVPNELIYDKDIDSIAFVIYSYILFNKNDYRGSYLKTGDILKCYYGKMPKRSPKLIDRIMNVLFLMQDKEYFDFDTNDVFDNKILFSENRVVDIVVLDNCYLKKKYTTICFSDFQKIMLYSKPNELDTNLRVFLYICSFMNSSKKDGVSCAFFRSLDKVAINIGIRKKTLNNSIAFLCSDECCVLKKHTTGIGHTNIYVLNNFNADEEIQKALDQIKKMREKSNDNNEE